jgi:hypothetical protein
VLAAMAASLNKSTPSSVIVNVAADAAELVTAIFVTTAVVLAGTAYRVVLDVAAAVLAITLLVVAISYYLPLDCAHKSEYIVVVNC